MVKSFSISNIINMRWLACILFVFGFLLISACSWIRPTPVVIIVTATAEPTATTLPPIEGKTENIPLESGELSWKQASSYIDEYASVCGPVVDSYYAQSSNGKPTFLNLGKQYPDPDRFTVLIWGHNRDLFDYPPEEFYLNQMICVRGVIEEYQGIAEIIVNGPAQIEIK